MTFLERLGGLWRREREATRARFVAERRGVPLAERVARGNAVRDLTVDDSAPAAGGRLLLWLVPKRAGDLEGLRVGPGDPVRLWHDDPDSPDAIRGTVARRRQQGRLAVVVDGDLPDWLDGGAHLDRDDPEATFTRGERAIAAFSGAPDKSAIGRLRAVLVGETAPRFGAASAVAPFDEGLNGPQLEAVARALAAEDVALVHGPPGTGKTRTLVEIIRQCVARGERVLAAAASNAAVDNLAERLLAEGVDVVRLGHPARVAPSVEAHSLDALLDETEAAALSRKWIKEARAIRGRASARRGRGQHGEARELVAEARGLERDARAHLAIAQRAIVEKADVLAATAAGADSALLGELVFDRVVLDEATQAVDPVALVALGRAAKIVLAGDPCQLPPTVIDPAVGREGLAETIFERLAKRWPDAVRLLTVQHRMHERIMAFPSASMYGGRLVADPSVAGHTLADLGVADDPLRPGPFVFVDTAGKGWFDEKGAEDPSTRNPAQAARVAAELRRLLSRGLAPTGAAVITPYDAEVRLLRDLLASELAAGLEVGTVDGFQGREKEAIVVDLVRSNDDGDLGFLADTRRMNVALTRARRFLLVVGDSATLGGHPYYAAFLQAASEHGAHVSVWTDEGDPL